MSKTTGSSSALGSLEALRVKAERMAPLRSRAFWRNALIGSSIALALVCGCGSAAALTDAAAERNAVAAARIESASDRLSTSYAEADVMRRTTASEDVADAATLDALAEAISDARPALATGTRASDVPTIFDWASVEAVATANECAAADMEKALADLEAAMDAVSASAEQQEAIDAHDALQAVRDDAQTLLDATAGQVADDTTRDDLSDAIAAADEALAVSPGDSGVTPYSDANWRVTVTTAAVSASHDQWQEAQAAARFHASSGGSYSDGTWYASYRGTDDPATANADGSLSEWRDGYYIAHDWSSNGQLIASKPGTVVVDGRTYRYVSSMVVSRDTKWSEVNGFVYANGGIGFQTCDPSGGYLITHYEPV